MSPRREIIIKMTDKQRKEIYEKLDKEVTHVKISVVTAAVVFAEALELPEV